MSMNNDDNGGSGQTIYKESSRSFSLTIPQRRDNKTMSDDSELHTFRQLKWQPTNFIHNNSRGI